MGHAMTAFLGQSVLTAFPRHKLQDPEAFIEDGGWSFLDADQSDSDEEGDEEESDFAPRWGSTI